MKKRCSTCGLTSIIFWISLIPGIMIVMNLRMRSRQQKNADMIHAALDYVQGSNRILEKLVSGEWDEQFLVAEPGHLIRHGDFF